MSRPAAARGNAAVRSIDPSFERSARRWLAAYPRRWRQARADEVLGTLVAMAPPDATRLDARAALGLLVGGLRTRARTGPPWHQRIGYLLGIRVPPRYVDWMADDLAAPVPTVWSLKNLLVGLGVSAPCWAFGGVRAGVCMVGTQIWLGILDVTDPARRRGEGLRLLLPRRGDPVRGRHWAEAAVPRVRSSARTTTCAAGVVLAWLTACGLLGWVTARTAALPLLWAPAALAAGSVPAAVAASRWRRWAGRGVEQPHRVVLAWTARARQVSAGFAVPATAWLAWGLPSGPVRATVATVVALGGLAVMPGAAVAWRWTAGAPDDVATVDLLRVAATGRPPKPDQLVRAAVRTEAADAGDLVRAVVPDRPVLGGA